LEGGLPSAQKTEAYYAHNRKVLAFLNQLKGTKFLILEPEFNKEVIMRNSDNQNAFVRIISQALDIFKANSSELYLSLSMMDTGARGVDDTHECGYEHCALGDASEWAKVQPIYKALLSKLDFISFNQMIGQFSRDHQNPIYPSAYSNEEVGIEYLAQRIVNITNVLHDTYQKPIFMPYIGIATATWSDSNQNGEIETSEIDESGWESEAGSVYSELMSRKDELLAKGLFGFGVMSLFDNPQNDINGYQYYLNNEYHLGIIKTSAIDELDRYRKGDIEFKEDIVEIIFSTP